MPAVSATILAAVSGPHPTSPSSAGARVIGQFADLPCQRIDRHSQLSDPGDEVPCDTSAWLGPTDTRTVDRRKHGGHRELARRGFRDAEFHEEPAQARLVARSIGDQNVTIVREQTELTLDAIESGGRQVRFAQGRPSD